ncbi:MAG: class I SAM-dependent methyltransferase [Thalassobaculum sp.]|uniref:class I SAM-dependent methyltransferase n=1 Tax=Thalassobaculum sp. TaxID=2022740 RepID=UPI0032ED5461
MSKAFVRNLYESYAGASGPDDFFGQVKHTVAGKTVSDEQISMIVEAVLRGLALEPADRILDLCCGNGALTTRFFAACEGGLGIDFSPTLIGVANKHFVRRPQESFRLQDVLDYVRCAADPSLFTKAVCHGGFQYLPRSDAQELLELLHRRFTNVQRVFLGNLPDRNRIDAFFGTRPRAANVEHEAASPLGIWRSIDEVEALSAACGWTATVRPMDPGYYAAHYRYDVVLHR